MVGCIFRVSSIFGLQLGHGVQTIRVCTCSVVVAATLACGYRFRGALRCTHFIAHAFRLGACNRTAGSVEFVATEMPDIEREDVG